MDGVQHVVKYATTISLSTMLGNMPERYLDIQGCYFNILLG